MWLVVGTDSGYEGLSAFYYARISYTLRLVESPDTDVGKLPATGGFSPLVWTMTLLVGIGAGLAALGVTLLRRGRPRRLRRSG